MDIEAKTERLSALQRELAQLRLELGLEPLVSTATGLSKREALLVEAERVAHLGRELDLGSADA